jgi:hypothetical protein
MSRMTDLCFNGRVLRDAAASTRSAACGVPVEGSTRGTAPLDRAPVVHPTVAAASGSVCERR